MASISLKHIDKVYPGDVVAVSDLNLEIQDQEFVVLVGPSGCGKSTTLRMIAGLEEISGGELHIGEAVMNDVPPKDRDIAMVFQNYALYPHMSVYKNMAFSLKLRKMPKTEIDERIQNAAEILDITHLLNRKPKALSGGQRQRVALGRAIVRDPSVFLLDEPLSNLDAKLRTSMRAEISKLHQRLGTTFVYVTHDQTEAMTMGDRIVVMKDGLLQQVDTPENLYTSPCNLFVATFIGTPQMNTLKVRLASTGDGFAAHYGKWVFPIQNERIDKKKLEAYAGKELILGIRPEDIYVDEALFSLKTCAPLDVKVDFVEMLGADLQIYATCGEDAIIATIPARHKVRDKPELTVSLDCTHVHLFDPDTEEAL